MKYKTLQMSLVLNVDVFFCNGPNMENVSIDDVLVKPDNGRAPSTLPSYIWSIEEIKRRIHEHIAYKLANDKEIADAERQACEAEHHADTLEDR